MEGIRVHKITKSGFGSSPGQIPSDLKVPLVIFDYLNEVAAKAKTKYLTQQLATIKKTKTNNTYRCPRAGFVPFDMLGRLKKWARDDGIPPVGTDVVLDKEGNLIKSPLYLVLDMKGGFIAASAVLYTQADGGLKLEYLCAAPRFKGAGKALLMLMKEGQIFKTVGSGIKHLHLNNNSGIPGFYTKYGFVKVGKTKPGQYMMKDPKGELVDKILNVYKASMMPSKVSKKPVKSISKKPSPTRVLRTKRKPLLPRRTLYKLRTRTIHQRD